MNFMHITKREAVKVISRIVDSGIIDNFLAEDLSDIADCIKSDLWGKDLNAPVSGNEYPS